YVIVENARVLQTVNLLAMGSYEEVGMLLWLSHAGLRDEYEVSCYELDTLVMIARHVEGVLGGRMMGAGFGGCTVNLAYSEAVEALSRAIEQEYPLRTGRQARIDMCRAAGGPGNAWAM
ncbi:MAG: galactokinase, partial [Chloroflexota bacterium]|nr:galactokinase [Chloroflexota bacterium]